MSSHFDFTGDAMRHGHGPSRLAVTTFSRPGGGVVEIPLDSGFDRETFVEAVRRDVEYSSGLTFVTEALNDVADHFRDSDNYSLPHDGREKVIVNVLDGMFVGALPNQFFGVTNSTVANEFALYAAAQRIRAAGILQYAVRLPALNVPAGVDVRPLLRRAARIMTYDPREVIPDGEYYWSAASDTEFANLAATVARQICDRATTVGACRPSTQPSSAPTLSPTSCPPGTYVARPEVQTRLKMRDQVARTQGANGTVELRRLGECPICLTCRHHTCPGPDASEALHTRQVGSCGVGPYADEDPETSDCNDVSSWTFCRYAVCAGHCVESSPFSLLAERECRRSCGLCTGNNGQTCALPTD